jgi:hypothetical protein
MSSAPLRVHKIKPNSCPAAYLWENPDVDEQSLVGAGIAPKGALDLESIHAVPH